MPTAQENLQTAYDNIAARLAAITANPKPTYTENGRTIQWNDYMRMLVDQLEALQKAIQEAEGPFEIRVQAVP